MAPKLIDTFAQTVIEHGPREPEFEWYDEFPELDEDYDDEDEPEFDYDNEDYGD